MVSMDNLGLQISMPSAIVAFLASLLGGLIAVFLLQRLLIERQAPQKSEPRHLDSIGERYLFAGRKLRFATLSARAQFEVATDDDLAFKQLVARFGQDGDKITGPLAALLDSGIAFDGVFSPCEDQKLFVTGAVQGGLASITVTDISHVTELAKPVDNADSEARIAADLLEHMPDPAWQCGPDFKLEWTNAAYRRTFGDDDILANPIVLGLEAQQSGGAIEVTANIRGDDTHSSACYAIEEVEIGLQTIGFAKDISGQKKSEASLARFVATLTETFAHLPTALAIFGADNRLNLFNPSLCSLTRLDPAWLAAQPTLREFFDALRAARLMPEQRTAEDWRITLDGIEAEARRDSWCEEWAQPDGQTIRARGRPHPNSAVAFLFEDITIRATLEREYKREIERSQATLDRLGEAVAVFNPAGDLEMANQAFRKLWPVFEPNGSDVTTIQSFTSDCAAMSEASDVWSNLRSFVTSRADRAVWNANVIRNDGRHLMGRFAPLPDGTTLILFTPLADTQMVEDMTQLLEDAGAIRAQRLLNVQNDRSDEEQSFDLDALPSLVRRIAAMMSISPDAHKSSGRIFVETHDAAYSVTMELVADAPRELNALLLQSLTARVLQRVTQSAGGSMTLMVKAESVHLSCQVPRQMAKAS
jgi:PAS domain-containing protein